jgi:hypothetical protein
MRPLSLYRPSAWPCAAGPGAADSAPKLTHLADLWHFVLARLLRSLPESRRPGPHGALRLRLGATLLRMPAAVPEFVPSVMHGILPGWSARTGGTPTRPARAILMASPGERNRKGHSEAGQGAGKGCRVTRGKQPTIPPRIATAGLGGSVSSREDFHVFVRCAGFRDPAQAGPGGL